MLKHRIISLSQELGFSLIGFCSPEIDDFVKEAYEQWLQKNYQAGMQWMERNKEVRKDPTLLLPGVQTIIAVALSYVRDEQQTQTKPLKTTNDLPGRLGTIAKYAQSRDYHYLFKSKMKKFVQRAKEIFQEQGYPEATIISGCDTKPIFERYFAWKAGLGFIGKNSLLITKDYGSYVLLGCFLTTVKLEYDPPGEGTCGKCTRCLDACPTKALVAPKTLDGSKCIAYWTIEHRGEFPEQVPPLAGRLFGCDLCQDVCPYNKRPLTHQEGELQNLLVPEQLSPEEILSLPEPEFRQRYQGTPLMRAGYEGIKRNARKVMEDTLTTTILPQRNH